MTVRAQPGTPAECRLLWSAMDSHPGASEWVMNVAQADGFQKITVGCRLG